LDPYPFMAHAEYSELSDADRAHTSIPSVRIVK
jgi:hypothetical protein